MKPWCASALLQDVHWESPEAVYSLGPGVDLCRANGTLSYALYRHLCRTANLDNNDPYVYPSLLLFTPVDESQGTHSQFGSPYGLLNRAVNVLAIACGGTVRGVRVLWSEDDFASMSRTEEVLSYGDQSDFLPEAAPITPEVAMDAATMWRVASERWDATAYNGRLVHALTYFEYAWRAPYIYHVCVNLSVALEAICAPYDQSEVAHQVAYTVAWLLGKDQAKRQQLYQDVKRFYRVRSALVHGTPPDEDKVHEPTVTMFNLMVDLLGHILRDATLARALDDETQRRALFQNLLFE